MSPELLAALARIASWIIFVSWVLCLIVYAKALRKITRLEADLVAERKACVAALEAAQALHETTLRATKESARQEVALAVQQWLDTRARWTTDVYALLRAEHWLAKMAAELERHGLAVPLPPELETRPRRDESDHFPIIALAAEERLTAWVREQLAAAGDPLGPAPTTPADLMPPAAG